MATILVTTRAVYAKTFNPVRLKTWTICGTAVRVITRSLCSGNGSDNWKNVLDYWFSPGAEKKWFHGGTQVDEEIRQKFSSLVEKAVQGELKEWETEPKPSLALIILTDQFTRSIFRNSAKAFSGDARARAIARKFIDGKTHNHLEFPFAERGFMYLPFEHSENKEDQELSVSLMTRLAEDFKGTEHEDMAKGYIDFATRHKEVIDKFGRYPQRNKSLGRENTPEEEEFLNNIPDRYKW
ncbi:uncharacterized protein LOC111340120 [Stylophora pistillata]|uniref:DUF924 domain-containing protein n=1 Tax=Stylophora pistillata TaxID=50429 RepID=A0A2B4RP00_STYPI|nr:uncharacterized protein LOC111340120 [Stylophora pistillata]PFX17995.1 hypothetical protein AWC38_SpisGene17674 [Stylophora pistillata]